MPHTNIDSLKEICAALTAGNQPEAQELARQHLPFTRPDRQKRQISAAQRLKIFVRDGFIDRYSGRRLVFPGTLRLLSYLMPDEFPYHTNWKMDACHMMYWELYPTIDHIFPIAQGGPDDENNWVSTCQLLNSAKANFTLDELGWQLHPPGDIHQWDGLLGWFLKYVQQNPQAHQQPNIHHWFNTAEKQMKKGLLF